MVVVKGFKGARIFAKIAFILLILAEIGAWIAYNSTGWGICKGERGDLHMGLLRSCYMDTTNYPICILLDGWTLGKFSTFIDKHYIGPTSDRHDPANGILYLIA